jgi:hypothetical protein
VASSQSFRSINVTQRRNSVGLMPDPITISKVHPPRSDTDNARLKRSRVRQGSRRASRCLANDKTPKGLAIGQVLSWQEVSGIHVVQANVRERQREEHHVVRFSDIETPIIWVGNDAVEAILLSPGLVLAWAAFGLPTVAFGNAEGADELEGQPRK